MYYFAELLTYVIYFNDAQMLAPIIVKHINNILTCMCFHNVTWLHRHLPQVIPQMEYQYVHGKEVNLKHSSDTPSNV
jgi:hypothetical protein